jgi:hypothetical protein
MIAGSGNKVAVRRALARNQTFAETNLCQVNPAIGRLFANKDQTFQQDATAPTVTCPALAGQLECMARCGFSGQLGDGHMRYVGPFFLEGQCLDVQNAVQIAHAGREVDLDIYRWRHRREGADFTKSYFKRFSLAADLVDNLQGGAFSALQHSGRKDRQVRREMGKVGMQLSPQTLYELSGWPIDVRHQRIALLLHTRWEIIPLSTGTKARIDAGEPPRRAVSM